MSEGDSYSVDSFEEPLYSELVRLGVAAVTAADYAWLAYLGADAAAIAAALQQCSSWEEALAWAQQCADAVVAGAPAADDDVTPAAWQQLVDADSGATYYQPLAADGVSAAGQWLWESALADLVAQSLAASNQAWERQVDESTGAPYFVFMGAADGSSVDVEGAPAVGTWHWEQDFIAQNVTVAAAPNDSTDNTAASVPSAAAAGDAPTTSKVKELKEMYEKRAATAAPAVAPTTSSTSPSVSQAAATKQGSSARSTAVSLHHRIDSAKKLKAELETALGTTSNTAKAMARLAQVKRANYEAWARLQKELLSFENTRRAAALRRWESARAALAATHVEAPAAAPWSESQMASMNFRFAGPTLKKDMVERLTQPLAADPASPFSTSAIVHLADGRVFLYNDLAECELTVTVHLSGPRVGSVGVNAKDSKQIESTDFGGVVAVQTAAPPNTLVQMFGLHDSGDAEGGFPEVVAVRCECQPIPQWRALQLRGDIEESVASMRRQFDAIDTAEGGNTNGVMTRLQRAAVVEYIDCLYPPVPSSCGSVADDDHRINGWRTPSMFLTTEQRASLTMGRGEPPIGDYHAAHLGGSFVAQAVAVLAQRPSRIDAIFARTDTNHAPYGRFVVTMLRNGWWTDVPIDHYMPVSLYDRTLARNDFDPSELAPSLAEKAAAKLLKPQHFGALDRAMLTAADALTGFTGFPTRVVSDAASPTSGVDARALMRHVLAGHAVLCVASSCEENSADGSGVIPGHAYSVVRAVAAGDEVVFRLRSPSGGCERSFAAGALSATNSEGWSAEYSALAAACSVIERKDDPESQATPFAPYFWVTYTELVKHFPVLQICEIDDKRCTYDYRFESPFATTARTAGEHPLGILITPPPSGAQDVLLVSTLFISRDDGSESLPIADIALFKVSGGGSGAGSDRALRAPDPFKEASLECVALSCSPQRGGLVDTPTALSIRATLEAGATYVLRPIIVDNVDAVGAVGVVSLQTDAALAPTQTTFVRSANASSEALFMRAAFAPGETVDGGLALFADATRYQIRVNREAWRERWGSTLAERGCATLARSALGAVDAPTNQDALTSVTGAASNARTLQSGALVVLGGTDIASGAVLEIDSGVDEASPIYQRVAAIATEHLRGLDGKSPPFADLAEAIHRALASDADLGIGWFVCVGSTLDGSFDCHDGVFFRVSVGNVQALLARPTIPKVCAACEKFIGATRFYNLQDKFGAYVHVTPAECLENFRLQRAPPCIVCGEKVRTWAGKFYRLHEGHMHEGECYDSFRKSKARQCVQCGEPLLEKWLVAADDPSAAFHEECAEAYKLAKAPPCAICGQKLVSQYYDTAAGKVHPGECYTEYKARQQQQQQKK